MREPFEIFKLENGQPLWREAVESLESATARAGALQEQSLGAEMVYSHRTGKKIVFSAGGGIRRD